MRLHHVFEDAQDPPILLGGCLGVYGGNSFAVERPADLFEQPRELLEPVGHVPEPFWERCEFAGHESIHRTASQFGVEQRVPGPFLQVFEPPQIAPQRMFQEGIIHLVMIIRSPLRTTPRLSNSFSAWLSMISGSFEPPPNFTG